MGCPQNGSGDLVPPDAMYDACRIMARYVLWTGDLEWDFSALHTVDIPPDFTRLIHAYLRVVLESPAPLKGWKIPETTLVYPWIRRMFPDIKYVSWIRDPRDCILGDHLTDDLADFGVPYARTDDTRRRRAISWKYQYDLVAATPPPANRIELRFEDFVTRQEETLARLEAFLGIKMARLDVNPAVIGRWKADSGVHMYEFLEPAMTKHGYSERIETGDHAGD